jgi:hypothetical protein
VRFMRSETRVQRTGSLGPVSCEGGLGSKCNLVEVLSHGKDEYRRTQTAADVTVVN